MQKEFYNFIYYEKNNIVFSYNPKVACTNWKCVFRYLNGNLNDYLRADLAHDRSASGLIFLSELDNFQEVLCDKSVKFYSFVRNPFTRALSAYLNKIEPYFTNQRTQFEGNPYFYQVSNLIIEYVGGRPTNSNEGFLFFLNWLKEANDFHTLNEHWIPQYKLLRTESVDYEFIGRLENVHADSRVILDSVGFRGEFPSQLDVKFAPTNARKRIDDYYSKEKADLVRSIYQKDFERFSYEPELLTP